MKLGGFEDIWQQNTALCSRCGAAECLSKGLHTRVMTKCTYYYGACSSTFYSILFYFKPLILHSFHSAFSIILHTHQNNITLPWILYHFRWSPQKCKIGNLLCSQLHNCSMCIKTGHKVDITVTTCIHDIPPTPQQLVYSDTSSP
jgi:hypothetical protein